MGCGQSTGYRESQPQPSVNQIQAEKGVSREEAYQEKLGAEFCDNFSRSGTSLRRFSVASASMPSTPKAGNGSPLSGKRRSSSRGRTASVEATSPSGRGRSFLEGDAAESRTKLESSLGSPDPSRKSGSLSHLQSGDGSRSAVSGETTLPSSDH
eukprot:CAMPEP_0173415340 /NCGR_PEP_ID=MMETSP1356-20130122/84807_1 /TAXON_ID=77927 ORGANISM="Hemiselmis virescens, Strain PCC157" /NCGR_SAMPLE_ID=MMETSP1356 /ASSEMBLY_ACC=CAM_ASM_000847 /LENGTH=153 /DNA_ID=CAMNT_0014377579 /DNA_START=91 /DNA_END=552 /DNA_ORIENTATION=+